MTGAGVAHVVLGLSPGGTERLVIELSKRTRQSMRGVICLDSAGAWADELTNAGIPVVALGRRPGFSPALGFEIARHAREFGASILHCHHYSPFVYGSIAAALNHGLRLVFTEHGRLSDAPPSKKRQLVNPLLGRMSGPIYAVSEDLKRHMIASGFPASRIQVIHNGVDPGTQPGAAEIARARAMLGIDKDAFVLGTVARLDCVKDLGTLLRSAALLGRRGLKPYVVVVGDGAERHALEQLASALGIHQQTRFLGHRDDARALLPGFDIYVNTSISEGISLTLLEAMAASRPVVATAVGGTPEVVLDRTTGVLIPPRAPETLADTLEELRTCTSTRIAMGLAGRARLEDQFSLEQMVARYEHVYQSVARS